MEYSYIKVWIINCLNIINIHESENKGFSFYNLFVFDKYEKC
jgi:hypothetical protein